MDYRKMKSGEIYDALEKGLLISNPRAYKYYAVTGLIFKKQNNYFTVDRGTVYMRWKGLDWLYGFKKSRFHEVCILDENTPYDPNDHKKVTKEEYERGQRHMRFLAKHFTSDYIARIRAYQLKQPVFLEVR